MPLGPVIKIGLALGFSNPEDVEFGLPLASLPFISLSPNLGVSGTLVLGEALLTLYFGKVERPLSLGLTLELSLLSFSLLRRRIAPIRRCDGDLGFLPSFDLRFTWSSFLAASLGSVDKVPLAKAALYLTKEEVKKVKLNNDMQKFNRIHLVLV